MATSFIPIISHAIPDPTTSRLVLQNNTSKLPNVSLLNPVDTKHHRKHRSDSLNIVLPPSTMIETKTTHSNTPINQPFLSRSQSSSINNRNNIMSSIDGSPIKMSPQQSPVASPNVFDRARLISPHHWQTPPLPTHSLPSLEQLDDLNRLHMVLEQNVQKGVITEQQMQQILMNF